MTRNSEGGVARGRETCFNLLNKVGLGGRERERQRQRARERERERESEAVAMIRVRPPWGPAL